MECSCHNCGSPVAVMHYVRRCLGDNLGEIINDALHCYAAHPENWSYDEELADILTLIRACDRADLNAYKPEYDVSKNPYLVKVYRDFRGAVQDYHLSDHIAFMIKFTEFNQPESEVPGNA